MVFPSSSLKNRVAQCASALTLCGLLLSQSQLLAGDIYVLPESKGDSSGSSWENATSSADGGITSAWSKLQAGDTLYIGSGQHNSSTLKIKAGGTLESPKSIVGKDTGDGLPVLTGNWNRAKPSKGALFIQLEEGASNIAVSGLKFKNVKAVVYGRGENSNLSFTNIEGESLRYGFYLIGGSRDTDRSSNITIKDCSFHGFTKSAVRLQEGTNNVLVENVLADAGGKDFATEKFHMAFNIRSDSKAKKEGRKQIHSHDITFINCEARNNYNNAGKKYWNADGFVAERGVNNLKYINCRAFDNTDGGWDLKATNVELINCVALRNKRNFRFWTSANLKNCVGAYAIKLGGSGGTTGLWTTKDAKITATNCTFVNNPGPQVTIEEGNGAVVELKNSVIGSTLGAVDLLRKGPNAKIETIDCLVFENAETAPKFIELNQDWQGAGPNFNNNSGKGYNSTAIEVASVD